MAMLDADEQRVVDEELLRLEQRWAAAEEAAHQRKLEAATAAKERVAKWQGKRLAGRERMDTSLSALADRLAGHFASGTIYAELMSVLGSNAGAAWAPSAQVADVQG